MTNTNTQMRKGFTMIELIFVIVIIGILAAVAIPKLAANKDDATAATCQHEFGQFITEISGAYIKAKDFTDWKSKKLSDITNLTYGVGANGTKGIQETDKVINGKTFKYNCDGEKMAEVSAASNTAGDYLLTVKVNSGATAPANKKATAALKAQYNNSNDKIFTL